MPKGQLYIRPQGTAVWTDAYTAYGVSFSDGALSKLMTPAPNKSVIENKSRLQDGKRIVRTRKYIRKDERELSLEMHLSAPDSVTFWERYRLFCTEILDQGLFEVKHADIKDGSGANAKPLIFRLTYLDCQQFSEFQQQLAKFTLRVNEPDPTNRGEDDAWSAESVWDATEMT